MNEELKILIDKNDIVSFDIFDTLIFRNILNATDIFKILDSFAMKKYNIKDFYNIRISSETEARTSSNNYECNINEIYDVVLKKIKDNDICKALKKEELDLELKFCVTNPFMKKIFDYCIDSKKKVVLISDMYLTKKFILKLLKRCSYDIDKVYISCEYMKNKGTGELFELVCEKECFDYSKWLHIGDNTNSDYKRPISLGMNAFNYKKVSTYVDIVPNSVFESIILAMQANYLYNGLELDYWDMFGVKYISQIYFGFTKWLYDLTKDKDNLIFLARDGYIIEQIYKLFNTDNKEVKTNYLYCSRNSLLIPSLYTLSTEKMVEKLSLLYNVNIDITLGDFLKTCSVDVEKMDEDLIYPFGFKSLNDYITVDNFYGVKKMLVFLVDNIKENLKDKYDLAIRYLKQEGLDNYSCINVMDIGWAGSIQSSIKRLLNKDVNGFYFGTVDEKQEDAFSTMFGYYFDLDNDLKKKEIILKNVMMFELIFSAPHGSTIGYEEKNNKIIPIINSNKEYNSIVEKFQKSAIGIIKKYIDYLEYFDGVSKDFCLEQYLEFLDRKNYNDVMNFKNLSNDFVLGSSAKFSYVSTITLDDLSDKETMLNLCKKSLWNNTFYIDGINDAHDLRYLYAKRKLNTYKYEDKALLSCDYAKIYFDSGNGFTEDNIIYVPYNRNGNHVSFKINIDFDVKGVRIDPIEGHKIMIKNLIIATNKDNVKCLIPKRNYLKGKLNNCIYIYSRDPKIIVKYSKKTKWIMFSANLYIL